MESNVTDQQKLNIILKNCENIHKEALEKYSAKDMISCISKLDNEKKYIDRLIALVSTKQNKSSTLVESLSSKIKEIQKMKTEYFNKIYNEPDSFQIYHVGDESLEAYGVKIGMRKPNISYREIYKSTDEVEKQLNDFATKCYLTHLKSFIGFGPKGNGKSLYARAFAHETQSKFIQIDCLKFLNQHNQIVPTGIHLSKSMENIIVYIKNIELLIEEKKTFLFIIEKFCEIKEGKNLFIVSCSCSPKKLPEDISKKFYYNAFVSPVNKEEKIKFIGFMAEKLNIPINLTQAEMKEFNGKLGNYSNEDGKKIGLGAQSFKTNDASKEKSSNGNKIGIEELRKAKDIVVESITPQVREEFNFTKIFE